MTINRLNTIRRSVTPGNRQLFFTMTGILLGLMLSLNIAYALPTHDSQNQPLPSLAPMLEKITPAVVNISNSGSYHGAKKMPDFLNDPFFKRFFKFDSPRHKSIPRQAHTLGSGVIVDAEKGYILTNNHVISDASKIQVTLKDGRKLIAELIGTDPQTDIAVIKIDSDNLSEIKFSDSDQLRVGDFALAIGHPFGLDQTVTSGIVSGLGRSGLGIEGYEDFIQTDASINPGNSGGALVNLHGELIGINTAIFSKSGGNIGIGFAIPVNMAQSVMQQLIKHGSIQRGILGVQVQDLTPELATAFDVNVSKGAIVAQVIAESAASRAGVKAGDIIIGVNGRSIDSSSSLRNYIGLKRPGDLAEIELLRGTKTISLKATIGGVKTPSIAAAVPVEESGFNGKQLHPTLEGAYFGPNGHDQGVQVLSVAKGSLAWQAGIRKDDIIIAINRKEIRSINDLKKAAEKDQSPLIALNIHRGNSALFLVLR